MGQQPFIFSDVDTTLKVKQMKADIDEYLKKNPQGSPFLAEIKQRLMLSHVEAAHAGTPYNVPVINSLMLYVDMQEIIQEQITIKLLECLIINRPYPWGLLITFIKLIKIAPEIEKLFESVSRSLWGIKIHR